MRLPGWCERCHKVRQVRVSGHGLASVAKSGVATGVCDQCLDRDSNEKGRT